MRPISRIDVIRSHTQPRRSEEKNEIEWVVYDDIHYCVNIALTKPQHVTIIIPNAHSIFIVRIQCHCDTVRHQIAWDDGIGFRHCSPVTDYSLLIYKTKTAANRFRNIQASVLARASAVNNSEH